MKIFFYPCFVPRANGLRVNWTNQLQRKIHMPQSLGLLLMAMTIITYSKVLCSVLVPESVETGEANGDDDDAMSLFGGSEFDEVDNDMNNNDMLEDIALSLSSKEDTGPPISEPLAKIINSKLSEDFDRAKLLEVLKKYKRPENCDAMYLPQANIEIWRHM